MPCGRGKDDCHEMMFNFNLVSGCSWENVILGYCPCHIFLARSILIQHFANFIYKSILNYLNIPSKKNQFILKLFQILPLTSLSI